MRGSFKKLCVFGLVAVFALSLALMGCSSPAASSTTEADKTPATNAPATNAPAAETPATNTPAAATIAAEWQGAWYSKSEIVPPEVETDQYSVEVAADGSFVLMDGDAELYTGTFKVTDDPEPGWGVATIDGKTLGIQLVNAQGIYKLIFNAGDDWDKSFKKVVFQR
jgi:hypothetical protein